MDLERQFAAGGLAPEAVRWMPAVVCHDMQQVRAASGVYFLEIKVFAEPAGDAPPPRWAYPVPAGLGRKIAALIAAECGLAAPGADGAQSWT